MDESFFWDDDKNFSLLHIQIALKTQKTSKF